MLRRIIKSISPKVIVEVVGYETNKMIINEIAHEMGISTIELQHGVIGRGHIAYNYLINREYSICRSIFFIILIIGNIPVIILLLKLSKL